MPGLVFLLILNSLILYIVFVFTLSILIPDIFHMNQHNIILFFLIFSLFGSSCLTIQTNLRPQKSAALMFDGVNDTIGVPHHTDFNFEANDDFMISIQVMPHTLDQKAMLLGKINDDQEKIQGWGLYQSGKDIVFVFGDDVARGDGLTVSWKNVVKEFSWTQIRLSYKGGTVPEIILYINGVRVNESESSGKVSARIDNNYDLYIASRNNVNMPFHGKFQGCTVWKKQSDVLKVLANWETGFDSTFPEVKDTLGRHNGKISNSHHSIVVFDYKKGHTHEL